MPVRSCALSDVNAYVRLAVRRKQYERYLACERPCCNTYPLMAGSG